VPTQAESQTYINDPRSGEILSANLSVYPNIATYGDSWYFVQAGAVDKRAQKLPLPDELQGELLRFVVSHQIGHTLGLTHNLKASALYTVGAGARSEVGQGETGSSRPIMDDTRFNYVAQPEDNMDPADLDPEDWSVRQVRDYVGLQRRAEREVAVGRARDARPVGAPAGRERRICGSRPEGAGSRGPGR
jgi:hypothetical protein